MFKRKIAVANFAVLALAVVAAGCGGGGGSTGSTGDTTSSSSESGSGAAAPTKAAFIKEADNICGAAEEELSEEISAYAKEHDIPITKEPSSDQEAELFQEVVLPNVAKQGEEIAALTPPEGDEGTIEELTSTLEEEVAEAESDGGGPGDDTLSGATKQAEAYGLKTCGS